MLPGSDSADVARAAEVQRHRTGRARRPSIGIRRRQRRAGSGRGQPVFVMPPDQPDIHSAIDSKWLQVRVRVADALQQRDLAGVVAPLDAGERRVEGEPVAECQRGVAADRQGAPGRRARGIVDRHDHAGAVVAAAHQQHDEHAVGVAERRGLGPIGAPQVRAARRPPRRRRAPTAGSAAATTRPDHDPAPTARRGSRRSTDRSLMPGASPGRRARP